MCLQVTWCKDGEQVKPSDRIRVEEDGCTRKLIIDDANVNDEGEYTCVLGENECTAELIVIGMFLLELNWYFKKILDDNTKNLIV